MRILVLLALSATLLVTACASRKWVNSKDTSANYVTDNAMCQNEAIRTIPDGPPSPPRAAYVPPPSPQSYQTNCSRSGYDTNCTTTETTRPVSKSKITAFMEGYNSAQSSGDNSSLRRDYTKNCLSIKGWSQVRVPRQ